MAILAAGTFRVSDYRKSIPAAVSKKVRARYEEDHRPPLADRRYDTEAGDFIPPQHDPDYIELIDAREHDRRTFGRAPGAERTATTAGSDIHRRAKTRQIAKDQARWTRDLLAPKSLEKRQPHSRWPKRPFRPRNPRASRRAIKATGATSS